MAFKMNRSIIKGTNQHKASIAKAKSIVEQSRTTADKSLVEAGRVLGESYIPEAVDFSIYDSRPKRKSLKEDYKKKKRKTFTREEKRRWKDDYEYYQGDNKDKKESFWDRRRKRRLEKQKQREAKRTERDKRRAAEKEAKKLAEIERKAQRKAERLANKAKREQMRKKEVIKVGKPTVDAIGGKAIANYSKEQKSRLSKEGVFSEDAGRIVLPEEIVGGKFVSKATEDIIVESKKADILQTPKDKNKKRIKRPRESQYKWGSGGWKYKGKERYEAALQQWKESKSPAQMRDNRIWKNAVKGGKVQKNMLKMGYIPPK
jgi:hypothetical protein|tara:strand:+ start:390 stop:1340 length:951 start_codon:yes stop_codon:yes gene_type:complete